MATVLLVENDAVIRELIEIQLERLGHTTVRPDGGGVASAACDVAVVEPCWRRAFVLAAELRERRPDLPLIFVSTREPTAATAALRPCAHLMKPFGLGRLREVLDDALGYAAEPGREASARSSAPARSVRRNGFSM